jgi:hypothetical protein
MEQAMHETPTANGNRRRAYRAGVNGNAIVQAGGVAVRCAIVDLGLGGVRLLEPVRDEPGLAAGVEVMVELECAGAGWVAQRGRVVRHHAGEIAVAFHALSPEVEDRIEDEVLGAVEAARAPRVVVVDRSQDRRHRLAEALRDSGCCSLEASTPLEAVDMVERSRNHVVAVAVAETLTQTQADELVTYLAESHPDVQVERISGDGVRGSVEALAEKLRRGRGQG